jgi:hypothetical protein
VFGKHNVIQAQQVENWLMNLSPNDFPCMENYLSKFKALVILCKDYKIVLEDDQCIYVILANLGSAYFVFVFTFYVIRESLGSAYKEPTLESFCDSLIRQQDKFLQLGVINTACTSNKALVVQ